ncbi:MAG: hypothetical protein K6G56_06335 [Clostridiales bacterium]|nr:hypothetical protein [Clostridiales bacterium]
MIYAYTSFKGCFDGDLGWLASWCGLEREDMYGVTDALCANGLIMKVVGGGGNTVYKSCVIGAGTVRKKQSNAPSAGPHIINIESIDETDKETEKEIDKKTDNKTDDTIEKKIDKDSIEKEIKYRDIKPIENMGSKDLLSDKSIKGALAEELMKLISPYKTLPEVPPDVLAEKLRLLEKKRAELIIERAGL